ncbi:ABC transporter ATP-binding protein [Cupriavidus necator]|uniref:Amino acid/amide ABC transporter ATP-binding protein 2, HAAT family n=2 Tax=Cupriavidus pinatubonensis TaxID=248026 RepID=Q46MV1_CUPPJ|nr:ABC transporter ATP-binding protein [Cupriavidus necator]
MPTNSLPALALSGVTSGYDRSEILQDVSLTVRPSTVLALLGRNGAGKTTCIHTIMGMVPAYRGAIQLFGEDIARLPVDSIVRRGVALVPQGRRLFSLLSVRENLTVARQADASDAGPAWTVAQVVEMFPRLGERFHQRAGTLSGGEQQMLAIGRALMSRPRVLLMDEPTEGLSPQMIDEVAAIVGRLRDAGLSILLVEQNSRIALSVADDAAVLVSGRVAYKDRAAELQSRPELMERFLGVVPGEVPTLA